MPGYEICEKKDFSPYRENGIVSYDTKIGFLDFLREIQTNAEGIPRLSSFTVVGIEEVLYGAPSRERQAIARVIHGKLQRAASMLHQKKIQVQIVCKDKLMRGDSLWLEYRGDKLPIDFIFGSTRTLDIRGAKVYTTGFNLST